MQNKTWIWVTIGLIIVGLVVWQVASVLMRPDPEDPATQNGTETEQQGQNTGVNAGGAVSKTPQELRDQVAEANTPKTGGATPERTAEQELEASLAAFAKSFVERIGTYSSSSNFANLKQAMPLMTDSMKAWARGVIADGGGVSQEVFSVVARGFASKQLSSDGVNATYLVTIQKETRSGGEVSRVLQDAEVDLVKVGEDWFVDEIRWQ